MEILIASTGAMVYLLGIGLVGFLILSKKIVGENIVQVLSPLALTISVPCLVFSDILIKFDPSQVPGWWALPLLWAGFTALTFLLSLAAGRLVQSERRREFTVSLFYPNAIFVPLAVLAGVFGPQSLLIPELFLMTLLYPALLFNTFDLFFAKTSARPVRLSGKALLHPVVIATAAAIGIRLLNGQGYVPGFVLDITRSLGAMALPLIMLLIGGSIYLDFKNQGRVHVRLTAYFVLCKNLLWPGLALLGIWLIRPPQAIAVLIFLQSAVPPVTAIPVLTARAGGDVSLTNQFLISSFLVSILTIPAGMWLLHMLYPGLF